MRHLQLVNATDVDTARRSYLHLLNSRGVALAPMTEVYVETVHRPGRTKPDPSWLCYVAMPQNRAA